MRRADPIHAHCLQHLKLSFKRTFVNCRAQSPKIVMITNSTNLHVLAIQGEPLVDIECKVAHAEWRLVSINYSSITVNLRDCFVEIRPVVGPENWARDRKGLRGDTTLALLHGYRRRTSSYFSLCRIVEDRS